MKTKKPKLYILGDSYAEDCRELIHNGVLYHSLLENDFELHCYGVGGSSPEYSIEILEELDVSDPQNSYLLFCYSNSHRLHFDNLDPQYSYLCIDKTQRLKNKFLRVNSSHIDWYYKHFMFSPKHHKRQALKNFLYIKYLSSNKFKKTICWPIFDLVEYTGRYISNDKFILMTEYDQPLLVNYGTAELLKIPPANRVGENLRNHMDEETHMMFSNFISETFQDK